MTSDNGDPTRPGGDGSPARRPSAIIDVKATAVENEGPGEGADTAEKSASAQSETAEPIEGRRERGGRGASSLPTLLTHAAAGTAGGVAALVAAIVLAPLLGQGLDQSDEATQDIERRLRTIETSPVNRAAGVPAELAQKLAATEQRLARLEDIGRNVGGESQARLAAQVKGLEERLAKLGPGEGARLSKLEDRIQQLSAAGGPKDAAATERIDREIADVKGATERLAQRVEALKALEPALRALQEETAALKTDVARELKSVARAQDVSRSLAPVSGKLSALEQGLESLAKSELDRKANAERIVLALELGNLKRVVERGVAYAVELAEVSKVAGGKLNLAVLERYKSQGVPPVTELAREFRGLTHAVIEADAEQPDASILDRLLAGAKSIVRVRKVSHPAGDSSVEAVVARMEAAVRDGNLALAIESAKALSPKAKEPARAWLDKVGARAAVDRAIADIDAELKASLGAGQADRKG